MGTLGRSTRILLLFKQFSCTQGMKGVAGSSKGKSRDLFPYAFVLVFLFFLWRNAILEMFFWKQSPIKVPKGHHTKGYRCAANMTDAIASQNPVQNSNCPELSKLIDAYIRSIPPEKQVTVVTVGCNKGYDFISAVRHWSRDENFSEQKLRERHFLLGLRRRGIGLCNAGTRPDASVRNEVFGTRQVSAWCFEPLATNFEMLNKSFTALGYLQSVHLVRAAVSSHNAKAYFPRLKPGSESASLNQDAHEHEPESLKATFDLVDVVTLDDALDEVDTIDHLSIDTEGNDMRVLYGSMRLLAEKRVRFLQFEYHSVSHWATTDLSDVIDVLDQLGYDCYFAGNHGQLWRVTGCWHDSYHKKAWSNIVCAARDEKLLHEIMEEAAVHSVHTEPAHERDSLHTHAPTP
jgi:FkbM family methyltransferase